MLQWGAADFFLSAPPNVLAHYATAFQVTPPIMNDLAFRDIESVMIEEPVFLEAV